MLCLFFYLFHGIIQQCSKMSKNLFVWIFSRSFVRNLPNKKQNIHTKTNRIECDDDKQFNCFPELFTKPNRTTEGEQQFVHRIFASYPCNLIEYICGWKRNKNKRKSMMNEGPVRNLHANEAMTTNQKIHRIFSFPNFSLKLIKNCVFYMVNNPVFVTRFLILLRFRWHVQPFLLTFVAFGTWTRLQFLIAYKLFIDPRKQNGSNAWLAIDLVKVLISCHFSTSAFDQRVVFNSGSNQC